jgi:hypothetical protein
MKITLTADAGLTTDTLATKIDDLHKILANIPELISYTATIN